MFLLFLVVVVVRVVALALERTSDRRINRSRQPAYS